MTIELVAIVLSALSSTAYIAWRFGRVESQLTTLERESHARDARLDRVESRLARVEALCAERRR